MRNYEWIFQKGVPPQLKVSKLVKNTFHNLYQGDKANLPKVPPALLELGLGYMEILQFTMNELKLGLGESIMAHWHRV